VRRPTATEALGGVAAGLTAAAIALEFGHVWRRGRAPLPAETDDVLEAGAEAARETVEVVVAGYRRSTARENALLNLLVSYAATAALARASTHVIRARGHFGPFHNRRVAGRHIHHFLPGIGFALLSGAASIISRDEAWDPWLAVPFGAGAALTLDEAALLVELEDVYWSPEGLLSVQVSLGAIAVLGALAVGGRMIRRGEAEVLQPLTNG
jgi:hypothetical protein